MYEPSPAATKVAYWKVGLAPSVFPIWNYTHTQIFEKYVHRPTEFSYIQYTLKDKKREKNQCIKQISWSKIQSNKIQLNYVWHKKDNWISEKYNQYSSNWKLFLYLQKLECIEKN